MANNLRIKLYEKYGAFSKHYSKIFLQVLKTKEFTLHDLTKQTGYAFKMVTTVVNDFAEMFNVVNGVYTLKPEFETTINNLNCDMYIDKLNLKEIDKEITIIKNAFVNHKPNIDHVACTAKTTIDRALKIANEFDVENCNILFLGDHDLTSVALKLLDNNAKITVIDIDNDVLNHIDEFNKNKNFDILTVFNDFSLPSPISLESTFDIVFTDPPYTPEGMDLFIKRALYFLNKDVYSTIMCAYGSSELSTTIGFNVQSVFNNNFLYIEEMLKKFNEYDGAEALGYRADLYTMRPTPNAWNKNKLTAIYQPTVYTHGAYSLEAMEGAERLSSMSYENSNSKNKILLTSIDYEKGTSIKYEKLPHFLMNLYNNKKAYDDIFVSLHNLYLYSYDQIILMLSAKKIHLFTQYDILNNGDKSVLLKQIFKIKKCGGDCNVNYYILERLEDNNIILNFYNNKIAKSINAFANIKIHNKTKNELRTLFKNSPLSSYGEIQLQYIPTKKLIAFNSFIESEF